MHSSAAAHSGNAARPGHIKPGTITNQIMSHNDWIPTLCAIAGEPDIVGKCWKGYAANGHTYKVHLDGYDQSKFLTTVSGTIGTANAAKRARNTFLALGATGLVAGALTEPKEMP